MFHRSLLSLTGLAACVSVCSALQSFDGLGNTTYVDGNGGDKFMFYYYESTTRPGDPDTPVVLWLQGGPGCAAAMGLFSENGPVGIDTEGKQQPRATAWNRNGMHLLSVDSPVGSGYSYNENGTLQTSVESAMDSLLVALKQAVQTWQPQLADRPLYVTGESFAGRWVPTLGAAILRDAAHDTSSPLKLAGVATGSGWTAPVDQAQCIPDFAYNAGLLGPQQRDTYKALVATMSTEAGKGDWTAAADAWNNVTSGMFMDAGMPDPSDFRSYGFSTFALFQQITTYMNSSNVREYLGVPTGLSFGGGEICSSDVADALEGVTLQSSAADLSYVLGQGVPVSHRSIRTQPASWALRRVFVAHWLGCCRH